MTFQLIAEDWYGSKSDAAQYAGVEIITIQKWIERGHLSPVKIGSIYVISKSDLDRRLSKIRRNKNAKR